MIEARLQSFTRKMVGWWATINNLKHWKVDALWNVKKTKTVNYQDSSYIGHDSARID